MDFIDILLASGAGHDSATRQSRKEMRAMDRRLAARIRRQSASQEARIEALEAALGRVTMLSRALAELLLAKGLVTRDELERALRAADLADGETDGRLDPEFALPGEERTADLEPLDDPPADGA